MMWRSRLFPVQDDRQLFVAFHEARLHSYRVASHLDVLEALHDLFPDNAKLHLGKTVAHTTVNAESERDVVTGVRPVDGELVRPVDHLLVAVA